MSYKPIRSSDKYIQFKRTITNKEVINIVKVLSVERLTTENDILYQFIAESAIREIKKRDDLKIFLNKKSPQ